MQIGQYHSPTWFSAAPPLGIIGNVQVGPIVILPR
jgi:hypothetical protein